MTELEQQLQTTRTEAEAAIAACADLQALTQLKAKYIGRQGAVTAVLEKLGTLPKEDKPRVGKLANEVKNALTAALTAKQEELEAKAAGSGPAIDTTLPGRRHTIGHLHPLTQIFERTVDIFRRMGFAVEDGPEVETEWHCFDALNTPADHPARDIQDTLYVDLPPDPKYGRYVMRTHTSPVQIRMMLNTNRRSASSPRAGCFAATMPTPRTTRRSTRSKALRGQERHRRRPQRHGRVCLQATACRPRRRSGSVRTTSATPNRASRLISTPHFRARGKDWLEIAGCGMVDPQVFKTVGYPDDVHRLGVRLRHRTHRHAPVVINDIRLFTETTCGFWSSFSVKRLFDEHGNPIGDKGDSPEDLNLPPGVQALIETRLNSAVDRLRDLNQADLKELASQASKKWRFLAIVSFAVFVLSLAWNIFSWFVAPQQIKGWVKDAVQQRMTEPMLKAVGGRRH